MISTCITVLLLMAGTTLATPNAKPEAIVPDITSSILEGYFIEISKKANVFPDATSLYGRLMLLNAEFKECLTIWGTSAGNGWAVLNTICDGTKDNSLTWLKHAGSGKINLALKNTACIGSGNIAGTGVYTGDWCDSPSHQFVIHPNPNGGTFQLIQAETGMCLATDKNTVGSINQLIVNTCAADGSNAKQNWRACDTTVKNCWPSNP